MDRYLPNSRYKLPTCIPTSLKHSGPGGMSLPPRVYPQMYPITAF